MIKGLLKARYCSEPMPYGVSSTGIAKLKENNYKKRYLGGNPNLYEVDPRGTLDRRKPKPKDQKQPKKKGRKAPAPPPDPDKAPRRYSLNKRLIRNRVLAYTHMLSTGKNWKNKKLFFWTVTFPNVLSDEQCYSLFISWITNLRSYYEELTSYLWVAERQKNGTVHFHLLIPGWMNVHTANKLMRASICHLARTKQINYTVHQAKKYNGVDIAKDRKTKKAINFLEAGRAKTLVKYITKYITKNKTDMPRLCWNCSTDWSLPFYGVALTRGELTTLVTSREQINENIYETDFVIFWRWAHGPPPELMNHLSKINSQMLEDYFTSIGKAHKFFNIKTQNNENGPDKKKRAERNKRFAQKN